MERTGLRGAPNLLIKQGAKLVANAAIEGLSTLCGSLSGHVEKPGSGRRNLRTAASRGASKKELYACCTPKKLASLAIWPKNSGLNSSEVLATLFDLPMKNLVRQSRGKQFDKIML